MEPLSSAFCAAFFPYLKTAQLHTLESLWSLVLEDETYCEGLKALGLEDVQDGCLGEKSPKQRDRAPNFHLHRIPGSSEVGSLVIWPALIPSEGPDYVLSGHIRKGSCDIHAEH